MILGHRNKRHLRATTTAVTTAPRPRLVEIMILHIAVIVTVTIMAGALELESTAALEVVSKCMVFHCLAKMLVVQDLVLIGFTALG